MSQALSCLCSALPVVREQFINTAVQLRRQAHENVLQIGPRFVTVKPGRLHQAHDDRVALACQLTARDRLLS
jgi:hypothetical protein